MKYVLLLGALLFALPALADTESEVKASILQNLKHTEQEDVAGVMRTVHSQSPSYLATRQMLQQLFPAFDLKYTLVSYAYVGADAEYAYARVVQKTEKVSGPAFQNNELESLQIFRKEGGEWKLWTQANLAINYL